MCNESSFGETNKKKRFSLIVLMVGLCPAAVLWAQTTSGTINGTVTDQSDSAVPDADVIVTSESTLAAVHVKSSSDGVFAAVALPVGRYKIAVTKSGFQTYSKAGIFIEPSGVRTVNVRLQLGSVANTVTISASAAQIETTTSETANQVGQSQTETLPLNGRNYQSLAALMPGVTNTQAGVALGTGGHGTSNAMSINGMGQNGTYYTLDGVWNMNTGNMTQTTIIPNPDTIEEVRVLQNNYSPKYSIMGASVVMIQTRGGTRDFHGNAFEYFRNTDLDARNFFAPTVPVEKQNIFGGTPRRPGLHSAFVQPGAKQVFFLLQRPVCKKHVGVVNTGSSPTADMRNRGVPHRHHGPGNRRPLPSKRRGTIRHSANPYKPRLPRPP